MFQQKNKAILILLLSLASSMEAQAKAPLCGIFDILFRTQKHTDPQTRNYFEIVDLLKKKKNFPQDEIVNRVEKPIPGLYESIPVERKTQAGNLFITQGENAKSLNTYIRNEKGDLLGTIGREIDPEKKSIIFDSATFIDKNRKRTVPSFIKVPGTIHLVPEKGIPTQLFITLRDMKLSHIPYGGLKSAHAPSITNIRTALELLDAPPVRQWLKLNPEKTIPDAIIAEAIPYTHTGQYITTVLTQSGHKIKTIKVESNFTRSLSDLLKVWNLQDHIAKRAVIKDVLKDGTIIPYSPNFAVPYQFNIHFTLEPIQ